MNRALIPGGVLALLVPSHQFLYGEFDRAVGHFRRYSRSELRTKLEAAGFTVERLRFFSIAAAIPGRLTAGYLNEPTCQRARQDLQTALCPFSGWNDSRPTVRGVADFNRKKEVNKAGMASMASMGSMRWTQFSIPTLREDPADAEVASHKLLIRAGLIRQLAAGIYSILPLAQRSLLKITEVIRQEMNGIKGQEFYLPAIHPAELWQESGRWYAIGDEMFRLKDRKGGDYCLGMTHEEIFTDLARNESRSYKQLPQVWYQIQTKFRDEARPKSGLLRVRQFTMKDAYSFDVDDAGLDKSFEDQRGAYSRIFSRCGLEYVIVEADSGAMGGSASNESMVYTDAGEDLVASCPKCGYAANTEKATSRVAPVDDGTETLALEKFPTPGVRTIDDLVAFNGGAAADRQIKTLVFVATAQKGSGEQISRPVLALVRGDHSINQAKFNNAVSRLLKTEGADLLQTRPAQTQEIVELMGASAGVSEPLPSQRPG